MDRVSPQPSSLVRLPFRGWDTPGQWAAGATLGVLVGLTPKDSLLTLVWGGLLLLTTANLAWGIAAGLLATWLSGLASPLFHALGWWALTRPALAGFWLAVESTPGLPWLRLQNTVVVGATLVGLAISPLVYAVSRATARRLAPWLTRRLAESRTVAWLLGKSITGAEGST